MIQFRYPAYRGKRFITRKQPFEGVLPTMERRYRDTDSQAVRDTLAKYLAQRSCEACQGSRLCEQARHVFINKVSLPTLVKQPIDKVHEFFNTLHLSGQRGEIAGKIQKEIIDRLQFLNNVGLNYLALERSAETLSGGEAQRIRLASQIGFWISWGDVYFR